MADRFRIYVEVCDDVTGTRAEAERHLAVVVEEITALGYEVTSYELRDEAGALVGEQPW